MRATPRWMDRLAGLSVLVLLVCGFLLLSGEADPLEAQGPRGITEAQLKGVARTFTGAQTFQQGAFILDRCTTDPPTGSCTQYTMCASNIENIIYMCNPPGNTWVRTSLTEALLTGTARTYAAAVQTYGTGKLRLQGSPFVLDADPPATEFWMGTNIAGIYPQSTTGAQDLGGATRPWGELWIAPPSTDLDAKFGTRATTTDPGKATIYASESVASGSESGWSIYGINLYTGGNSGTIGGVFGEAHSKPAAAQTDNLLAGVQAVGRYDGTGGTLSNLYGANIFAQIENGATGTVTNATGLLVELIQANATVSPSNRATTAILTAPRLSSDQVGWDLGPIVRTLTIQQPVEGTSENTALYLHDAHDDDDVNGTTDHDPISIVFADKAQGAHALTFDGADNTLNWQFGFEAQSFTSPGDVEVTTAGPANGVILKSPDGTRWRCTVDNFGALACTSL